MLRMAPTCWKERFPLDAEYEFELGGGRGRGFGAGGLDVTMDGQPVDAANPRSRITSYNVCYTKLLRVTDKEFTDFLFLYF